MECTNEEIDWMNKANEFGLPLRLNKEGKSILGRLTSQEAEEIHG